MTRWIPLRAHQRNRFQPQVSLKLSDLDKKRIFVILIKQMVKISKHIGVYFMLMSMLVIIGHSIIPHHHHSDVVTCQQSCDHGDDTRQDAEPTSRIASLTGHQCETAHHHEGCESCQFETAATTPLSKIVVDYSIFTSQMLRLVIFTKRAVVYFDSWSNHYSFDFDKHTASRGPPALG